jgi:hypothetical protein
VPREFAGDPAPARDEIGARRSWHRGRARGGLHDAPSVRGGAGGETRAPLGSGWRREPQRRREARQYLLYAEPKRVLARSFAQVMARRSAGKVITLTQPSYAEPRSAVTAADFGDGVISALNQVRAKGGLPAVRLSAPQSALATQPSAHYFAAEDRPDEQETIALGLLAGWQITGMIRDGSFVSTLVPHTRDPGRWLSSTLAMPIGRSGGDRLPPAPRQRPRSWRDLASGEISRSLTGRKPAKIGRIHGGRRWHGECVVEGSAVPRWRRLTRTRSRHADRT